MASKMKAKFVVVKPITLRGVQRAKGFLFTGCFDGVHVTRWVKEGRIELAQS